MMAAGRQPGTSTPSGTGCVECDARPAAGGSTCAGAPQCGHIGCCDTSPSQHASAHAGTTGHPLIRSFEPGEDWFWSYPDEDVLRRPGAGAARSITRWTSPSPARPAGSPPTGSATCTDPGAAREVRQGWPEIHFRPAMTS